MFCEMRGGAVWDMSSACIQGGIPRPLGTTTNVLLEPHSPAPAWQLHYPKQEPVDEERNDSGINSGSDFHSSPGSENSQDFNHQQQQYLQQIQHGHPSSYYHPNNMAQNNIMAQLGFNPLSPPVSEPMISPTNHFQTQEPKSNDTTLTPCTSPNATNQILQPKIETDDPLRKLQMTLEKNGLLPPPSVSPKPSEHGSMGDADKSDQEMEEYDEKGLRMPKMNSHGKVKTFKCKQCDFVAITKLDFWDHSKEHIKADKLLTCPKCPFVTEYKHHLEYHLRNHVGSKPFKCDKCSYSCVNKSMLNSHMKSHSNVYQYRCSNCTYATKYCHSLKLHLRKYNHKPAMVLNPDGTPNPLPIIDVYGTRRGPKQKTKSEDMDCTQPLQNPFAQLLLNAPPQMQLPFPYPFLGGFSGHLQNPLLFQNLGRLAQEHGGDFAKKEEGDDDDEENRDSPSPISNPSSPSSPEKPKEEVLDLSRPEQQSKNRRKGKAFKIPRVKADQDSSDEDTTTVFENVEVVGDDEENKAPQENDGEDKSNNNNNYNCPYCDIAFGDAVLYTMHMGYHGFKDPFTCNMCGEQCSDKVTFFLHIARTSHS